MGARGDKRDWLGTLASKRGRNLGGYFTILTPTKREVVGMGLGLKGIYRWTLLDSYQ